VTGTESDVVSYQVTTDSARITTPGMPGLSDQMPNPSGQTQVVKMDTRGRMVSMEMQGASDEAQAIIGQLSGIQFELPEGEVSPGATWTGDVAMDAPGMPGGGGVSMGMNLTYTFVGVVNEGGSQLATIRFEGPVSMSADAGAMTGISGSGKAQGMVILDVQKGRITSAENNLSMALTVAAAGMSMSQTVSSTMELIGG
jgi:hypothetical protein